MVWGIQISPYGTHLKGLFFTRYGRMKAYQSSLTSIFVILLIRFPEPVMLGTTPYFTSQPQPQAVMQFGSTVLHCTTQPPARSVTWLHHGMPVPLDDPLSGYRTNRLHQLEILNFQYSKKSPDDITHDGPYVCIANTSLGVLRSEEAVLENAYLGSFNSSLQDQNVTFAEGNTALISCHPPPGAPKPEVQFRLNDQPLGLSDRHFILPSGNLHIKNVKHSDAGLYRCVATNPISGHQRVSQHIVRLLVQTPTERIEPKFVTPAESDYKVVGGETITIECVSQGSPVPRQFWTREKDQMPEGRYQDINGNLIIEDISLDDSGTYVCNAFNGVNQGIPSIARIYVIEPPRIYAPPSSQIAVEGASVTFRCLARGKDVEITWYYNGARCVSLGLLTISESSLIIQSVTKAQAGIYQCIAKSPLGQDSAFALLQVKGQFELNYTWPTLPDLPGGGGYSTTTDMGRRPSRRPYPGDDDEATDPSGPDPAKQPPSVPEVTQVDKISVRVEWTMPDTEGLAVQFFRIQYKKTSAREKPDRRWQTVDEIIETGSRSHIVSNLEPGEQYKFRVSAVFSDNDNKQGPMSRKFTLQDDGLPGNPESPTTKPLILTQKPLGPSAISMTWRLPGSTEQVDGFLIQYKPHNSNMKWSKVRVNGSDVDRHVLSQLMPNTDYLIKMTAFNRAGSSPESNTVNAKTLPSPGPGNLDPSYTDIPPVMNPPVAATKSTEHYTITNRSKSGASNGVLYIVLGVVLGVMLLFLLAFVIMCWWKQRQHRSQRPGETAGKTAKYSEVPATTNYNEHRVNGGGSFLLGDVSNGYAGGTNPGVATTSNAMLFANSPPGTYFTGPDKRSVHNSFDDMISPGALAHSRMTPLGLYTNQPADSALYYQVEPVHTGGTLNRIQMGTFGANRSRPHSRADVGTDIPPEYPHGVWHHHPNKRYSGEGYTDSISRPSTNPPSRGPDVADHIPRLQDYYMRQEVDSPQMSGIYEHINDGSLRNQRRPFGSMPRQDQRKAVPKTAPTQLPPTLPPRNASLPTTQGMPPEPNYLPDDPLDGHLMKTVSQEVIPSDGDSARGSTPSLLNNPMGTEEDNSPYSSQSQQDGSLPSLPLASSPGLSDTPHTFDVEDEAQPTEPFLKNPAAIPVSSSNSMPLMGNNTHGPRANDYPSDEEDQ